MTDDNSTAPQGENLVDMNDLDAFTKSYYDPKVTTLGVKVEEEAAPEASEIEDDALATEETDPEGESPEENNEPEDKPTGKKSAQERINEVVAKQRAAERERDALAERLRQFEAAATKKPEDTKPPEPTPLREQLADMPDAPLPDAKNEDGSPKYALGEFDPLYIRDLTRYTIAEETKKADIIRTAEEQRRVVEAQQAELQSNWLKKVETVEAELPDLREKITEMEVAFQDIEPKYGEFLAATIMSCDYGPEIMYYLSQNIGEAQKIVASGPAAATLALGRLDARFTKADTSPEEKSNKKPSSAPTPPPTQTRGHGGQFTVAGDTDNLAAFEKAFYTKK